MNDVPGNEEVSFREKIDSNNLSPTTDGTGRKGCKASEVSSLEQVRTSSIVYNTEWYIRSEGFNGYYDGIRNIHSKGSDLDSSHDETKSDGSGSRILSYDKST